MTLLVDAALRSGAVVAFALVACALLRRQSAALRHRVLAVGILAAGVVLPLALAMPSWLVVPLPSSASATSTVAPGPAPVAATPGGDRPSQAITSTARRLVPVAWGTGVVAGVTFLLIGAVRLTRMTSRATRMVDGAWPRLATRMAAAAGIRRKVTLLITDERGVVATWGLFRPRILLPAQALSWDDSRKQVVLLHELAHIRRHDCPVQIATEIVRTVFWFNPLLWLACARLRRESERACDDAVLNAGVPAGAYAAHLVEIARTSLAVRAPVPALPIARPSTLEGRIAAMLNSTLDRREPTRRGVALALAALLVMTFSIGSFDVSAQGPSTLSGYVYDMSGSVLPAAEVVLEDEQQVRWSTPTDGTGRFEFAPVGTGRFVLEVSLAGFRTLRHELELPELGRWRRDITLQVGELEETITVTARRPERLEAAPAANESGGAGPVRVGGNIRPPLKVEDARPVYPAVMREAGLEGLVPLEATIATDGSVASVRVLSAQVRPEFARAAEEAVRQWRFTPTFLNGAPVEVRMSVSVRFSLSD